MSLVTPQTLAAWFRKFWSHPKPIIICTALAVLSGFWWVLFSVGVFAGQQSHLFDAVALSMQLGVIAMGIFLTLRLQRNRPRSFIQSVPRTIRIVVPLAVVLGAVQFAQMPGLFPARSPGGDPVRSFDARVKDGVCVAVFNGTERVVEPLSYCESYQTRSNRILAGAWLLFSSIELWAAWAIYGAEPVRRVQPDRKLFASGSVDRPVTTALSSMRPKNAYFWLIVRLAILVFWTVGGWRGFKDSVPAPAFILLAALLFASLSTRYAIVQAYTDVERTEAWLLPSWFVNPFQKSQPFQFFQLGGLCFVLFGSAGLLRAAIGGERFSLEQWPAEALAAAFGLGILLGIHWAIRAYRSRFQRVTMS